MNRLTKNSFQTSSRTSLKAEDDEQPSNFSHAQSSLLYSDVTLEMIDDFLNPLSSRKPQRLKTSNILNIKTATGGLGIKSKTSCDSLASTSSQNKREFKFKSDSYLPFSVSRENNDNFEYAKVRQHVESRYYEHTDTQSHVGSILRDEMSSIVGSGMSQIESVSAMSTSTNKKHVLFNQIKRIEHLNIDEDEEEETMSDLNNNLNSKVNRILDQSEEFEKTFTEAEERQNRLEELLRVYKIRQDYDTKLPITEKRNEIIDLIENNQNGTQFCIIQGGTGCGKTTQIPQYILDHYMKEKKYCNIIVTQPRRIAAISISKRVCNERSWNHGSFCGYQIGLDRTKLSEDTRITYCTTGVLLQKLIGPNADENFNSVYTHILLDEVHERDLDTDFVMLLIKLKSFGRLDAKIVLMSATLNISVFTEYFAMRLKNNLSVKYVDGRVGELIYAPYIEIKSKMYDINELYWDQLTASDSFLIPIFNKIFNEHKFRNKNQPIKFKKSLLTQCDSFRQLMSNIHNNEFLKDEPEMYPECMFLALALLVYFDCKENEEIQQSKNFVDEDSDDEFQTVNQKPRFIDGLPEVRGSVLIFVPGMEQIKQLQQLISEELPNKKLNILPLHSDIVISQQNKVFEKSQPTWRKVIISTSIAESSITVPDVKYVIDFCLTKELYCDPFTNYTHLRLEWASISNLNQRRGRAGRVSEGFCYRLIPQSFLSEFNNFPVPAILREPLHRVILNVKRLKRKEEPKQILAMAIQPPKLLDIERTVLLLKECGALSLKKNSTFDGDLTYAGRIMANLPIDVRLSKLILLGHAFGKLRECIIIAAGLSNKTFFTCYYKSHLESFKAKWTWSEEWMCDCITLLNAYNLYESQIRNRTFERPGDAESWARKNMIEIVRIREVEKLVIELTSRLKSLGIICNRHVKLDHLASNVKSDIYEIDNNEEMVKNNLILKMIIAGAFYPNYFTSISIDLQEAVRMCNGKDFKNTVQLRNFPRDEGVLYTQKICDMFKVCSKLIKVSFQDTKCFVEFNSNQVSSSVNLGVYLAVQMRLLSIPLRIKRYNARITHQKLKRHKKLVNVSNYTLSQSLNSTRHSRMKSCLHLDSTISESESRQSDYTAINSDEDDEERGKFLDPERYIVEKGQEFMSYQTLQNTLDKSTNALALSINYDNDQSLIDRLSDPKFLFPSKVDQLKSLEVFITDVIECAHFWVQIVNEERSNDIGNIHDELNSNYEFINMKSNDICQDSLCVSYYNDVSIGKAYYRAKIVEVFPAKLQAEIIFVDYGNKATRSFKDLYYLSDNLKDFHFQAIECKIVNVRPSIYQNPTGQWAKTSNQKFNNFVDSDKFVSFEIIVQGLDKNLAYVNLHGVTKSGVHEDFTEMLLKSGCAEMMSKTEIDLNLSKQFNRKDFYIPSRESDYMSTKPRFVNEDIAIRQAEQFKNNYYHEQTMLSDLDDLKSTISANNSLLSETSENAFDENDESSYDGYIEIRGPYSPLECSYSSLLNVGQSKKIKVERDSINYVSLDNDPTNDSSRLLIAHEVTLNQIGNTMVLRKTSLMPKLPGLPSICGLLFAPTIELRTNKRKTMFTGALCGLGFDENKNTPIYTDNDIELAFDVQIDVNDIIMINSVRMAINMVIGSEQEVQTWTNDEKNLRILQQKACEKLLRLFLRNRKKVEPEYYQKSYRWNQVRKEDLIDPLNQTSSFQTKDLYYTYHKIPDCNDEIYE